MSAYSYGPTFLKNLNELMGKKAFKSFSDSVEH